MARHTPASTHTDSDAVRGAFARGDFATVRRLAPQFTAPRFGPSQPPVPLFAPQRQLLAIAAGTAALIVAAWIYALLQR